MGKGKEARLRASRSYARSLIWRALAFGGPGAKRNMPMRCVPKKVALSNFHRDDFLLIQSALFKEQRPLAICPAWPGGRTRSLTLSTHREIAWFCDLEDCGGFGAARFNKLKNELLTVLPPLTLTSKRLPHGIESAVLTFNVGGANTGANTFLSTREELDSDVLFITSLPSKASRLGKIFGIDVGFKRNCAKAFRNGHESALLALQRREAEPRQPVPGVQVSALCIWSVVYGRCNGYSMVAARANFLLFFSVSPMPVISIAYWCTVCPKCT